MAKSKAVEKTDSKARIIGVRGMVKRGKVVSAKAKNMAVVEVKWVHPVSKFERLEKKRSKIHVHVPEGIRVTEGDLIEFGECRKISKTKSHIFIRKIAKESKETASAAHEKA